MSPVASGPVASIVPFDPTMGITIVASVMLTLFVVVMLFFAVAPLLSSTWTEQLGAEPNGGQVLETEANEAD